MNPCEVYPLFSSNLVTIQIEDKLDSNLSDIKKYKFFNSKEEGSNNSQASYNMNVLENFPILKNIILDEFSKYTEKVLRLNCEFFISKSWITKVEKNCFSQNHLHKNSFYSGIFYFDDYTEKSAMLEIYNPLLPYTDFLILPDNEEKYNIFNSNIWKYPPSKNKLIFFPSYLNHRISEHSERNPRYSLAFNIVPKGQYGMGDSKVYADWKLC